MIARLVFGGVLAIAGFFVAWDSRRLYHSLATHIHEDVAYAAGLVAFVTGLFVSAMGLIILGV